MSVKVSKGHIFYTHLFGVRGLRCGILAKNRVTVIIPYIGNPTKTLLLCLYKCVYDSLWFPCLVDRGSYDVLYDSLYMT